MSMQLYQIRLLTLLNCDQGTKYFTIRTVLRDVRKSQNVMAKYYRCLWSANKDDDFYKALLRVDEDMVSHLCEFFSILLRFAGAQRVEMLQKACHRGRH